MDKRSDQSWLDLIRKYFPDTTDRECNFILWGKTSFPFVGVEEVERQLVELKQKECGVPDYDPIEEQERCERRWERMREGMNDEQK